MEIPLSLMKFGNSCTPVKAKVKVDRRRFQVHEGYPQDSCHFQGRTSV
jgi:hypothetical protein